MQETDSSIAFGRFRMDLTRRVLTAAGLPVALPARAFDILEYLTTHRDRPVTRDEITCHVWRGVVVGENNLSVQMSTLRRVLAEHGGADLIVTVPHRGYQFVEGAMGEDHADAARLPWVLPHAHSAAGSGFTASQARGPRAWRLPGALIASVVLVLAVIAVWRPDPRQPLPVASSPDHLFNPPPHTVAVLAFTNLSGDPTQDYLSDGLSEELIEALSQIHQVQVTARTSSFFFKGKAATIRDIAQTLNVAAVVEGSVRRQGDHLRIEARLTDARTGFELWSRPFDSDFRDLLKLEADIAAQVADGLKIRLAAGEAPDGSAGGTASALALDAYLRGVQNLRHDSMRSYRAALANFNVAIGADPDFALAYAGKANALIMILNNRDASDPAAAPGANTDGARFSDAVSAARRGVQLAPVVGATHIALANVLDNALDLRGAWTEAERAQALAPGDATVNLLFSFIALSAGRSEDAMRTARRAIEQDPMREDGWLNLGQQYRVARNYSAAIEAYQHAQTLAGSETSLIAYERALAYIAMGNPQRALDISLRGSDWTHMECRAIALHALGRQHDAEQTLADLIKADDRYGFNYVYAEIFAQWRQPEEALRWLTRAKEMRDSGLSIIKFDPMMDPMRQQPAFKAIVAGLNFPD